MNMYIVEINGNVGLFKNRKAIIETLKLEMGERLPSIDTLNSFFARGEESGDFYWEKCNMNIYRRKPIGTNHAMLSNLLPRLKRKVNAEWTEDNESLKVGSKIITWKKMYIIKKEGAKSTDSFLSLEKIEDVLELF